MKKTLLVLALMAASSAFALDINDHSNHGGDANQNQGQTQGQQQGQAQLQGQGQGQAQAINSRISNDVRAAANAFAASQSKSSSNSAAVNLTSTDVKTGGNTLSNGGNTLTVNEAAIPTSTKTEIQNSDYTVRNVPAFALGNVYPTAPCMGSSQVGGSGVGFSVGVGTSWTDRECTLRETARSFAGMGLKEDSLAILCTSEYAVAAPSCIARAVMKAE